MPPLPVVEEGGPQFPQPRHWRAEATARPGNGKCGKAANRLQAAGGSDPVIAQRYRFVILSAAKDLI